MNSDARCQMLLDAFRASRDADYAPRPGVTIDWFALALDPERPGKPCIQKAGQPHPGFFVAQTAIPADPRKSVCDPAHWVDSNAVPYVTLPGDRLFRHGVRKGDLALVHRRVGGVDRLVAAVAGDVGNADELGEGSIALHRALGNTVGRNNLRNIGGGVTTIFFPGREARRPITAESLEAETEGLLRALGGREAAIACGAGR
jgi:hypothetical protein